MAKKITLNDQFKLGSIQLKNRLYKSATAENSADSEGRPLDSYMRFYKRISEGGVGMIITGHIFVNKTGAPEKTAPLLDHDDRIPEFKVLTEMAHKNNTAIFAQINDAGREGRSKKGEPPRAPYMIRNALTFKMPRAMSSEEINVLVGEYADAAKRAKAAGFDGIQLHGAHGYLIHQFLSPRTNRRTDSWGGKTTQERMAFVLAVLKACREKVGKNFPILIKLSGNDHLKDGLGISESVEIAKELEKNGIDGIEVSGGAIESGFYVCRGDIPIDVVLKGRGAFISFIGRLKLSAIAKKVYFREGYNLSETEQIRRAVKVPILAVGGLRGREGMEKILQSNRADLIGMARPLIRQPKLPNKMLEDPKIESTCAACNLCLVSKVPEGEMLRCLQRTKKE